MTEVTLMNEIIPNPEAITMEYLSRFYFPSFLTSVTQLEWDGRYRALKAIYDAGAALKGSEPWEERTDEPIADMMQWVGYKGYFPFFCRGVVIESNGAFRILTPLGKYLEPYGTHDNH